MQTKISSTKWCSAPNTLRRSLLAAALPLLAMAGHAQLNIGSTAVPTNSDAALQVNSGTNRGILFPRVALTSTSSPSPLSTHVKGMTVYNTASTGDVLPGFYSNDGSKWVSIVTSTASPVSTASTSGTPSGIKVGLSTAPDASAALEVTSMNNNKGLLLPLVNLSSSTSPSPLGAATAGMMVYNMVTSGDVCPGTYVNNGSTWLRLESACAVTPPASSVLPATVTLAQNQLYWIASVYDNNYLPYTAPTTPAILPGTAADNASNPSTSPTTVNYQGTLTTTGITVHIPATVTGGSVTVNPWSNTITIPAEYTQDGTSRQITLSWASQSVSSTTTYITGNIKSVGGSLLPKQLDINTGIGNDYLGFLLGGFQYPYNSAGTLTNYQVRDIPGIPDRMFGQTDNAGVYEHNFLYLPIKGDDGNIWLNNNLGANYANLNDPNFNLVQQATNVGDLNAMGSLFQWGRKPDGHEVVNRYIPVAPNYYGATFKNYGVTTAQATSWSPTTSYKIAPGNANFTSDWLSSSVTTPASTTRWAASSPNNPCPQGFKVPTTAEWTNELNLTGYNSAYNTAYATFVNSPHSSILNLTGAGYAGATTLDVTYGTTDYTNGYYAVGDGSNGSNFATTIWAAKTVSAGATDFTRISVAKSVRCIQQ